MRLGSAASAAGLTDAEPASAELTERQLIVDRAAVEPNIDNEAALTPT